MFNNSNSSFRRFGSVSCFLIALFILTAPLFQAAGWGQSADCRSYLNRNISDYVCSGFPVQCSNNFGRTTLNQVCVNVSSGFSTCTEGTASGFSNVIYNLSGCVIGCNSVAKCGLDTFFADAPAAEVSGCFANVTGAGCPSS